MKPDNWNSQKMTLGSSLSAKKKGKVSSEGIKTFPDRIEATLFGFLVNVIGVGIALVLIFLGYLYLKEQELGSILGQANHVKTMSYIAQTRQLFGKKTVVEPD